MRWEFIVKGEGGGAGKLLLLSTKRLNLKVKKLFRNSFNLLQL